MKRLMTFALALTLMGVLASMALAAQQAAVSEPQGNVTLGKLLWTFRAGTPGMTPGQRAEELDARMVEILSDARVCEQDIRIVRPGRHQEPQIMAGRHLLVTVTRADARANETTPLRLARVWASRFRSGWLLGSQYRSELICYLSGNHRPI